MTGFTYVDKATGKYLHWTWKNNGYVIRPVDNPKDARLMCREFLFNNLACYEKSFKRSLEIRDVTEEVWANYPECIA